MKRREFITLIGGAAAWPFAGRAQQPAMQVIGFLSSGSPAGRTHLLDAFRQGLREGGFVESRNVSILFAWAEDHYDRLDALAADLVRRQVAVIATPGSTPAALAATAATKTIPIVFAVGPDPVQLGLVASLNQPGGNATGVSFLTRMLAPKQLELLHEVVPNAANVGYLVNPEHTDTPNQVADVRAAARTLGLDLLVVNSGAGGDLETAFAILVQERIKAVLVQTDPFLFSQRAQLATLAARHGLVTMFQLREYVEAGGLLSYGAHLANAWRLAGSYTARILNGVKPADLPVEQPTKLELVINLKAAKALGLDLPPTMLTRADEVIE